MLSLKAGTTGPRCCQSCTAFFSHMKLSPLSVCGAVAAHGTVAVRTMPTTTWHFLCFTRILLDRTSNPPRRSPDLSSGALFGCYPSLILSPLAAALSNRFRSGTVFRFEHALLDRCNELKTEKCCQRFAFPSSRKEFSDAEFLRGAVSILACETLCPLGTSKGRN